MRPNRLICASFDLSAASTEATPGAQEGRREENREIGTQCDAWGEEANCFTYSPLYKLAFGREGSKEKERIGGSSSKPRNVRLVHKRSSTAFRPELRSPNHSTYLSVLIPAKSPCDLRRVCPISSFNPIAFRQQSVKKHRLRVAGRRTSRDGQQRTNTASVGESIRVQSRYYKKKAADRKNSPGNAFRNDVVQSFVQNQKTFLHIDGQKHKLESVPTPSRLSRSRTPFPSTISLKIDL